MKIKKRLEITPDRWLPEASRFGNLLESNDIRYAIFGAGALAVHDVLVRPTIDIDFVVDDYEKAISIIKEQSELESSNLEKERDGIQVADFNFKSGVTVQIWDNNMYSLPMTEESWSRVTLNSVGGYSSIRSICMEDLIVSKVGRHTQQYKGSKYEANKNANDIILTIQSLTKPDFKYIQQRLNEGARRETTSGSSSKIHNLMWYFVKEVEIYKNLAQPLDGGKIDKFMERILVNSKSKFAEYWMLHRLRKSKSIKKFQEEFGFEGKNCSVLLKRWNSILEINGDEVITSAKKIEKYVETLEPESISEYANKLIFSGKKS